MEGDIHMHTQNLLGFLQQAQMPVEMKSKELRTLLGTEERLAKTARKKVKSILRQHGYSLKVSGQEYLISARPIATSLASPIAKPSPLPGISKEARGRPSHAEMIRTVLKVFESPVESVARTSGRSVETIQSWVRKAETEGLKMVSGDGSWLQIKVGGGRV